MDGSYFIFVYCETCVYMYIVHNSYDIIFIPYIFIVKVIQRRGDYGGPRENFDRTWTDYKRGFGSPIGEFWLGNENIHQLTKSGDMMLRVELKGHDGRTAWAEYDNFRWVKYIIRVNHVFQKCIYKS